MCFWTFQYLSVRRSINWINSWLIKEEPPYKPLLVPGLQVGARHGGVNEETVPNYGMVAFRAGSDGGERGIRTLDGVAPKPHFQCGAIDH